MDGQKLNSCDNRYTNRDINKKEWQLGDLQTGTKLRSKIPDNKQKDKQKSI